MGDISPDRDEIVEINLSQIDYVDAIHDYKRGKPFVTVYNLVWDSEHKRHRLIYTKGIEHLPAGNIPKHKVRELGSKNLNTTIE